MWDLGDTIAAVATARQPGGLRGIVRISGPRALPCLARIMTVAAPHDLGRLRGAWRVVGVLHVDPPWGSVPCDAYVWPTPRSYTREPCVELHTFGSPPLLDGVVATMCREGVRLARPGEFTLRAFLAGRLDLTQAEAVLGIIEARDAAELDTALQQLAGGLARPLRELRERLLDLLAHLEAGLDFVDQDIAFIDPGERDRQLAQLCGTMGALREQIRGRSHGCDEPRIVLIGSPNAGKSSLFNLLAGGEHALVSGEAGTTRDFVTQRIAWQGRHALLVDTAGLDAGNGDATGLESRGGGDLLSRTAQQVTARQAEDASLEVFCLDASRPVRVEEWRRLALDTHVPRLVVLTKCDQPRRCDYPGAAVATSSVTGQGRNELLHRLAAMLEQESGKNGGVVAPTALRCDECLRRAAECLERARQTALARGGDELIAAELRIALDELGAVLGTVYTDDVLDRIFGRFCIGK